MCFLENVRSHVRLRNIGDPSNSFDARKTRDASNSSVASSSSDASNSKDVEIDENEVKMTKNSFLNDKNAQNYTF